MEDNNKPISKASENSRDPHDNIRSGKPRNCARGERGKELETLLSSGIGQNPLVNASREANAGSDEESYGSCQVCLKEFRRYRPNQRFCGPDCRFLFWAARKLVREHAAGNVEGIRSLIESLK